MLGLDALRHQPARIFVFGDDAGLAQGRGPAFPGNTDGIGDGRPGPARGGRREVIESALGDVDYNALPGRAGQDELAGHHHPGLVPRRPDRNAGVGGDDFLKAHVEMAGDVEQGVFGRRLDDPQFSHHGGAVGRHCKGRRGCPGRTEQGQQENNGEGKQMAEHERIPRPARRPVLQCCVLAALAMLPAAAVADPPDSNWAVVDTAALTLTVYAADGQRLARYTNIAIGSGGAAAVHYHGDDTTPLGNYRIVHIRPSRSFDTFYLLDYPRAEHADEAVRSGRLTADSSDAIIAAARAGDLPPQDTALGGAVGIHGVGRGSMKIHQTINWTDGCIALANGQLQDFARHATVG